MSNAAPVILLNQEPPINTTPRHVDLLIIRVPRTLVLIRHRDLQESWSLPGGYMEDFESPREAAIREAREETGLEISIVRKFGHYSFIDHDGHCRGITSVFLANCAQHSKTLHAGSDAIEAVQFPIEQLPSLRIEHREIVEDYLRVYDRQTPVPFVRGIRLP